MDHSDIVYEGYEGATCTARSKKAYRAPCLREQGTLGALTQGFAGSVPDEQGGQTKRNPFQG